MGNTASTLGISDALFSKVRQRVLALLFGQPDRKDAPIFGELRGLLEKTVNVTEPLKKSFERYASGIHSAFVFGSVAKGSDTADSDVDILVIGDDLNYSDLYTAAQEAEQTLKRPVHPLFMSSQDWHRHASDDGSVINKISQSPKLFFIGSENDLRHG
jgi:predicted nucleotidyltransferase